MKTIIYYLYIGAFLLLLTECTQNDKITIPTDYLDKNKLAAEKTIRMDTLNNLDSLIFAKEFLVYQDSVLVVVNNKHKDGYFIEFYKLNDMKPITRLYKLGNGPNEILSANVDLNKNILIINDYIKSQTAIVNIDSVLTNPAYSPLPIRHQVAGSPTAILYKGKFLLENPYSFVDKNAGIKQNAPRFIVTNGKEPYLEKKRYPYYTRNVVVNGRIIQNESKNRIIYANMYKSSIELYDMNLNLLKKIEGPFDLAPRYAIEGEEGGCQVSFREYIPYGYLDYCTDNNYFYLTYVGDVLREGQKMKNLACRIFQFDWDGNFITCYSIHNYVLSISKSQKENAFYITTLSPENNPILIKLYEN